MSAMRYEDFKYRAENVVKLNKDKTAMRYLLENKKGVDKGADIISFSFGEIFEKMQNTAEILRECGVKPGDRAAIIAPHSPYAVIAGLSLAYANVTAVLIDASLPDDEIIKLLEFSDVRCIFTTAKIFEILPEHIYDKMPCFELGKNHDISQMFKKSVRYVNVCDTQDRECDVVSIIFSSGTTDRMKGIKMTYHSLIRVREIIDEISGNKISEYKSYLLVLPFNHLAGYSGGIAYFLSGCELDFIENVNASKLADGLKKFEPYFFVMIPKVYEVMEQKICTSIHEKGRVFEIVFNGLMKFSGFMRKRYGVNTGRRLFKNITASVFGKNIKGIGTGASPCKSSTTEFFLNLGLIWYNFYASTETNIPITATGIYDNYPVGTVGNVNQNKGIEVKISNPDKDGIGEVMVKTDLIMKGYFRQPQLTEKAFDNGWFKTGDYGYINKAGYLYLTGRMKESIVLASGKKVSPTDVDDYYMNYVNDTLIASCGLKCEDEYDEIHMYVQIDGKTGVQCEQIRENLMSQSKVAPQMYKLSKVHFIEKIPLTTVGKVKRFMLSKCKEILSDEPKTDHNLKITEQNENQMHDISADRDGIIKILKKLSPESRDITENMRLVEDLGLDSLGMFELASSVESIFNIDISRDFLNIVTVQDLIKIIFENGSNINTKHENIIPESKSEKEIKKLKRCLNVLSFPYKIETIGLENIDLKENVLICSNHASFLDGIWILKAMEKNIDFTKIAGLAAYERQEGFLSNKLFKILGQIPVERSGNTVPAMNMAKLCLLKGYNMVIFPEGARSRNGSMLPFKKGTAKLAIDTDKMILPIRMEGTFEIFPRHKKYPSLFDWKHLRRHKIKIIFGEIIGPRGYTVDELTEKLYYTIEQMKNA